MINRIIHLVTNRSGDFHHLSLASVADYEPHTEPKYEKSLREFLRLNDTDTDYYVVAAISSIYAFPELYHEFGEQQRTFDLSQWRSDDDAGYPSQFVNTREDAFNLHRVPTEFPVAMQWDLSFLDSATLLIKLATRRFNVTAREANGILYVEWPEELGIQGAIDLNGQSWSSGFKMTVLHTPTGFPYTELVRQLDNREDARRILTDRGYMDNYYSAQSDIEKCALTYTALAWPANYE